MNPFHHGNPVTPQQFLGRKKELRRTTHRIRTSQSVAIVGEPRTGKTSLLLYLAAPENHSQLYGNEAGQQRFFVFLDALAFDGDIDQAQFWQLAFAPLFSAFIQPNPESALALLYARCVDEGFNHQGLALLFDQLEKQNSHLVVLVDEFDSLLNLPLLCRSEFLGSLRSLAMIKPALSLVIASHLSIAKLNNLTQQPSKMGSPFFNFAEECALSPFTEDDIKTLLSRASARFSAEDIDFIAHAAGSHPYLLQAIAAELWALYDDEEVDNAEIRRQQAAQSLYDVVARTLDGTWKTWSPAMRMAFTVVALAKTPHLLEKRLFNNKAFLRDLRDFGPELRDLEKQGYVKRHDNSSDADWRIVPAAFQWWLSDELVRVVRCEQDFSQWLQAQEFDGLLTKDEKKQLIRAGQFLADLWKGGVFADFFKKLSSSAA